MRLHHTGDDNRSISSIINNLAAKQSGGQMQRGAPKPSSAIAWGCRRICKGLYSEEEVRAGA